MPGQESLSDHWGVGDVLGRILAGAEAAGLDPSRLTVEQLAPVDHFHARGFSATRDLADVLPIREGDCILDIGCGVGGPARYLATRFGCEVDGIDITAPFVEAANRLTEIVGLAGRVRVRHGDGAVLPYDDGRFDGAIALHVTMNVPDRDRFFAEAFRVLKPGGFFALTEHGLGPVGAPHHPLPWSEDGSGAYLMTPGETVARLEAAGFARIERRDTGEEYLAAYKATTASAETARTPAFGVHILLGPAAPDKVRNAARNIEERRTHPVQIVCRKPAEADAS